MSYSQEAKFEILPYVNGMTSIKEGNIEVGPEFIWNSIDSVDIGGVKIAKIGDSFTLRPSIRLPLTNKTENVLQIDRFTSTWKGILAVQYTFDNTAASGSISRHSINTQFEYGSAIYKYYPTANKTYEEKPTKDSYSFELKYIGFFSKGAVNAFQYSPQFRVRYSYDWKSANEVGIVNPINSNGITTTSNLIIGAPNSKSTFSPAFSLQIYSGKGNFSYAPTIYYDMNGKKDTNSPFNNINRLRFENWVFFYPSMDNAKNIKIGITPFVSIRTLGNDDFNKIEYGGMISIKFGTSFLQFF